MELKIFSFRIDIKKKIQNEYFETVQNDIESNVLRIALLNGAAPYNLYGLNVNIIFKKSDGTRVMQEVTKTNDVQGQIECVLKSNTIACAGIVEAEIKIMEGIKLLTSAKFEFYVRETLLTDDAVESTNEFPVLMQLINETNELIEEVRQIEEQVPENVVSRINTLETTMLTKFDKANLANNLITTAAGFGLDARQGKVLQDQITAQNNKLVQYTFSNVPVLSTVEQINAHYDNYGNSLPVQTWYKGIATHGVAHPIIGGSTCYLEGYKNSASSEWQKIKRYASNGLMEFTRAKSSGAWTAWTVQ